VSGRLNRFSAPAGNAADYVAIERERADRMEKRADDAIAILRDLVDLKGTQAPAWDAARKFLAKHRKPT
jgi:hypothetical protein